MATQFLSQMLWNSALIAAPVLGVALLVGLLISVLQVMTQVQEMSLTFIPKLAAVTGAMILLGPWMVKRTLAFATMLISNIPSYF